VLEDAEAGTISLPHAAIRRSSVIADPWEGLRGQERRRKGS